MSGYYSFGGVPSLGNERLWCRTCQDYAIHKWAACIHCGTKLPSASYRRAKPLRRTRSGPIRKTDPVTGLERKS